jgi:ATP-binding cassette subfamily B multidrug efflux pump
VTPIARLISYVRRVRRRYVVGAILTVLYSVCFQFVPLSVRRVWQEIESAPIDGAEVARAAAALVGAAILLAGFRFVSRLSLFRTGREIEYRIRDDLFAHLQRLPQSFFARSRTGDLMSRAVNDINSVRLFLGMGFLNIVQLPVLYVGAFAVMFWIDWVLALWVLLPYPLFIAIARVFGRRMHAASLAAQEQLGQLSAAVQENAAGVLVVRSYAMEGREAERFEHENRGLYRRQVRLAEVQASMQATIRMLPAFAMIVLLVVGGLRVRGGAMSHADLWAYFTYIFMLTFPTFMLGWVIALAQRGLAGLARLGEVLDQVPSIRDRPDTVDLERIEGRVEFRGLDFSYELDARAPALRGVHLRVEPGRTLGVVGAVGAGKSTFVNMIPRVFEVPDGTVFVDGVDVNRIALRTLRSGIAMVPQESFLFSTTIAENVRFGRPDATHEEVREAARRAHILEEIESLPLGFGTPVGERGITLSGGQRQRLALARALLLDPAILILDDALSSVDAETEESILKELRAARAGRTCFIVAHRLSAVRDADHIVVLEEGSVVEEGSHDELVRKGGVYARIHRRQQLEAEIEAED